MRPRCLALLFSIAVVLIPAAGSCGADSQFVRDVLPIFQKHCLDCHNSLDRKGDFSLQKRSELVNSGHVEPGTADDSSLLAAILPQNGKRPTMPKGRTPLSKTEVQVIREWIDSGAPWPDGVEIQEAEVTDTDWWSLKPVRRPPVPMASGADSFPIQTPIDAFILQSLQDRELTPSPPADRRTMIRRLTYDLTGLPPTPEAVNEFVSDPDPLAYNKLVDRLLHSPHYGERWARHWLDIVKYADTCGYDKDKLRPNAWPYRDYVIRSFNEDKPYSQFVHEQIAGDVMYPGTPDGILGLGFIAAGPWDFIGHAEVPETKIDGRIARHIDRDEMVTNTLNTFCSATIQCARCHNHKFDPFTQQHYYSLQAVFAAVDRADRQFDLDPEIESEKQRLDERLEDLRRQLAAVDDEIKKAGGTGLIELQKKAAELGPRTHPKSKKPEYGYHSHLVPDPNTEKWIEVDLGREVEITRVILRPCHDEFAGILSGFGFPVRFRVEARKAKDSTPVVLDDQTGSDVPNPKLAPYSVTTGKPIRARFVRVTATKLVERQNDYMLALSELQVFNADEENVALKAKVASLDSIEAPVRWSRKNLTDGIFPAPADEQAAIQLLTVNRQLQSLLEKVNTPTRIKQRSGLQKSIAETTRKRSELPGGQMVYAAATHFKGYGTFGPTRGKPRTIKLLHRGNILQPRAEVTPGTIPAIARDSWQFNLPEGHSEGDRRAALAQWVTRHDNPLTWRSIVNRVWQYYFGQGLVDTPNDLGRMGQQPTHPELLDWLASEFRDNGQSFRKLHRLIVLSSVYRQSSAHDEANAKIDGSNRYLWRMNRRRLEAEEIRDAMLAASGRLRTTMGGPGYYLFVLEKTAHSPHYEYHKFDPEDVNSHRRSVYRFIVRSQPDPYMTTLDCADSSQSTPQRNETLTSLQALSLLNNRFGLSMAKHFANRLATESDNPARQIQRAMQLVAGRQPTVAEQQSLQDYAAKHGLPNLCRVLFNLSEFVFLD